MLHFVGNIFEYYYDARPHERYKYICFFEIIAEKRVAFITYHLCRVSGLSCLKPLGYNENAGKGIYQKSARKSLSDLTLFLYD
jgi:hypothetical protein